VNLLGLIQSKKAGRPIEPEQMDQLVGAVLAGAVPDYQLAALLTVICYEKLNRLETVSMTRAFLDSGDRLSWEGISRPVVDKHSTGGVGDKVSLALVPSMAAAGLAMPKMSGRGLGHTGGTIDKLESIPGLRTDLSLDEIHGILEETGCVVAGQTAQLVPADKIFYALRDATDTVREMGLVAASVMSKKLAAGAPCIVLDVKCGNGAFFLNETEAREFAGLAMHIGGEFDRQVACVISDMDQPLGQAVGNTLEVLEVIDLLAGKRAFPDLRELLLSLGSVLLVISQKQPDLGAARLELAALLDSGIVYDKFREWIRAQGGRLEELPEDIDKLQGVQVFPIYSLKSGIVSAIDCAGLGEIARRCGAGRLSQDDVIVANAGLLCHVSLGDRIEQGTELARLFMAQDRLSAANTLSAQALAAFRVQDGCAVTRHQTVIDVLLP
jgi:pyrimidine-nucleoside phosphorylase